MTTAQKKAWTDFGTAVLAADPERAARVRWDKGGGYRIDGLSYSARYAVLDAIEALRDVYSIPEDSSGAIEWATEELLSITEARRGDAALLSVMVCTAGGADWDDSRSLPFTELVADVCRNLLPDGAEVESRPRRGSEWVLRPDMWEIARERWGPGEGQNGRKGDFPSQEDFANDELNVSDRTLRYYLSGTPIPLHRANKIAEKLKMPVEDILIPAESTPYRRWQQSGDDPSAAGPE